jgi:quercetin dioxygenase-like cupin family protein
MSSIHRFKGKWGEDFVWDGARTRVYSNEASGATETWLIGKAENAENFAMRYYELQPGGHSREEHHPYDHGVLIIRGSGEVLIGEDVHPIARGDVVYIAPDDRHQIRNTGGDTLGWICIIPARRYKQGKMVWAEEGLDDLQVT